jgi:phage gpG-like protein
MIDFTKVEQDVKAGLPEVAKNPESAWQKVSARLLQSYRRQFLTGGDGRWIPKQHGMGKLMMQSGALYDSATTYSDGQSAQLNWGFGLPYARGMQVGMNVPVTAQSRKFFWAKWYGTKDEFWKNMALTKKATFMLPARQVGLSNEDMEYIYATLGTRDVQITTNWGGRGALIY